MAASSRAGSIPDMRASRISVANGSAMTECPAAMVSSERGTIDEGEEQEQRDASTMNGTISGSTASPSSGSAAAEPEADERDADCQA